MKIVITDGYTLNGGDLSWETLQGEGELMIYDRTSADLIVERCKTADVVLTNKVPFSKETLEKLPNLKLICVLATGYNIIDVVAAKSQGVVVCNVPAYGTHSVAQHTFALLLELVNHVGMNSRSVADGGWERSIDWSYSKKSITELSGKIMGIVGLGNIGKQTAKIAQAFGMTVHYYTPSGKPSDAGQSVDLNTLFENSDVISLHCPLKKDNMQFVNNDRLSKMKPTALLLNTSRGGLIHEKDLADALNEGRIAGAALDVLSTEPPASDNPLLHAKNCIITPHNAWMSREARGRILEVTQRNVAAFREGKIINAVTK